MLKYTILISILIKAIYCSERYSESLYIKPLPTGHVYSFFEFSFIKEGSPSFNKASHYQVFPRSIGEILNKYKVYDFHFSLTQGLWSHKSWGYPVRDAPPGAQLWAWFHPSTLDVSKSWLGLINALSGQYCASLNFIDVTNTVSPNISLGGVDDVHPTNANRSFLRYGYLPHETVCTENLTPWRKLLPCNKMTGFSRFLRAGKTFNSNYFSLAIDVSLKCKDENCSTYETHLRKSISLVSEPISLDKGKQDWSFFKLYATDFLKICPLSEKTMLYVDISSNMDGSSFKLNPEPQEIDSVRKLATYNLQKLLENYNKSLNLEAIYENKHIYWLNPPPYVHAHRFVKGYGVSQGGIQCYISNHHPKEEIKITYMDIIPWYLRIYLHTLSITSRTIALKPDSMHYIPGKDRGRPHLLELTLRLPPKSTVGISFDFDRAFLKWTEYPPDANHGFYVGSSIISTFLPSNRNVSLFPHRNDSPQNFIRLHTNTLLVSLPTPDFSMPYNVICLACTVVAFAFGPLHNIITKKMQEISPVVKESIFQRIKNKLLFRKKNVPEDKKTQ